MTRRTTRPALGMALLAVSLILLTSAPALAQQGAAGRAPDVGKSYRVPYRLTDTNHFLVRVRVNGKGPFNFLVDTGAPALYIATETAEKVGLKPDADEFWTGIDRLDFEGGASLQHLKARVEDPFQLVGMNALGLPGASIDGILGFTMLARFKIELDPTQDRMTWTRLDYEPAEPPVPRRRPGDRPPADMQAMNALGPIAKVAAAFVGRQPEVQLRPRGFVGVVLDPIATEVRVAQVLKGSPAEKAGLAPGDVIEKVGDKPVAGPPAARAALAEVLPDGKLSLTVRRKGSEKPLELSLNVGEGL